LLLGIERTSPPPNDIAIRFMIIPVRGLVVTAAVEDYHAALTA